MYNITLALIYFQSETCSLSIPQLDFEAGPLSLSGRFTTIEGLIGALYEQLKDTATAFYTGDSQSSTMIANTERFLNKLNKIKTCKLSVDIILTDPAGNSYIQVCLSANQHNIFFVLFFIQLFKVNHSNILTTITTIRYNVQHGVHYQHDVYPSIFFFSTLDIIQHILRCLF